MSNRAGLPMRTTVDRFKAVMSRTAAACATMVIVAWMAPDTAVGRERGDRTRGDAVAMPFWGDQKGCYWERGRRWCTSYCYWEADGRRYCHDHERRAHPQGDPSFRPYPPEPPIYVRPPHYRPH